MVKFRYECQLRQCEIWNLLAGTTSDAPVWLTFQYQSLRSNPCMDFQSSRIHTFIQLGCEKHTSFTSAQSDFCSIELT